MSSELTELRGKPSAKVVNAIQAVGAIVGLLAWWGAVQLHLVTPKIFPDPVNVLMSFPELVTSNHLVREFWFSLRVNLLGYTEAVCIALPIGYLIGLNSIAAALSERLLSAIRYLPISALLGLFIAAFGIEMHMKVQFLTLGILVYLIPAVVVRINEVPQVYDDTAKTIGASKWQRVRYVFWPAAMSALTDDILNLTALSWTYIMVVEAVNSGEGGLGPMFYMSGRIGRVDKVYALLLLILGLGYCQDKVGRWIDRQMFPHKR